MDHDFYGPGWADNHHKLSDGIDALFKKVGHVFGRLHDYWFDAPWRREKRDTRFSNFR
jgi:hypothetical protein